MENQRNKILIPVDFSEASDAAVEHALMFAKQSNAILYLLHVVQKPLLYIGRNSEFDNKLITEATQLRLEKLSDRLKDDHDVDSEILAVSGNVFDTINHVANEIDANFVFMGTHGMKGMQYIFGSNVLKVVNQASCPYVLTQEKLPIGSYERIVFPLSIKRDTLQKTEWAIYLAEKFGATIHVYTPKETDGYRSKKLAQNVKYIQTAFDRAGINYSVEESDKGSNDFAFSTNSYAESIQANLVLIMVYPSEGAGNLFVTPSQQAIISNPAGIPVLCISPGTLFMLQNSVL